MQKIAALSLLLAAAACAACSGGGGDDSIEADARVTVDAAHTVDAPAPTADAPVAASGFGVITGCPDLTAELVAATPSSFTSHLTFAHEFDAEVEADLAALTPGGQEIVADGNAGGSSLESEIFAYELFARCDGATLLKTETEIVYDGPGKITDLLVEQDGHKLGVSVTRAVAFPFDDPYTEVQARELLERKLGDILENPGHVAAEDRWTKQALAVLAYGPGHADALAAAYATIDAEIRADTILWITVTDGTDAFVY